jgi:hypothetical protein
MKTMQQLSALLLICTLFATTSFGQVRLGPSVGFNYSTLLEDNVDNDFVIGLRAGLTVDLGIAKFFSVVPEVNFSQMGWKFLGEDQHQGQSETARLNYIEVPLNLVFKLGGKTARFLIFAGPYAAYAINGNIKMEYGEGNTEKSKAPFGTNQGQINPLDIGLDFGVGAQIKSFFFKLQYNAGLNNMSNVKANPMTNGALAFSLGYFLF